MAIQFISVNASTNDVKYIGGSMPFMIDKNVFTTMVDDSDTGIKDLLSDMSSHKFNDLMGTKPYITANYNGTQLIANIINNPNVSTVATVSMLGNTYACQIVDNQIVVPISIHPCVANVRLNATINVDGIPFSTIELGGSGANVESQIYFDGNSVYNVVPAKSSDLGSYWQSNLVDLSSVNVDLATITGILAHTLFNYVLPNMTNLTLTTEEQNGLNEIKTNLLPLIPTILSNISPDGSTLDLHYASYRYHSNQAKQAIDNYMSDRNKITQYVTLK